MGESELVFHPGAEEDYVDAFAWYSDRSAVVAARFEVEIERCLGLIREAPARWPPFDPLRRRVILRTFPYSIIYELIRGRIVVLAVAHAKRKARYWRTRASSS